MTLFKNKYRVESIRLPEYDYSQPGYYYITICTKNREYLFGNIIDDKMMLSAFGHLIKHHWRNIPNPHKNIRLDAFVVMPNHIHGIIVIEKSISQRVKRRQMTLFKIIGKFKMNTAKKINQLRNTPSLSVWQRNYYEHIIRNKNELNRIRQYIKDNPINWGKDRNNV
jgi:REP element-mobilizing transposase RayT